MLVTRDLGVGGALVVTPRRLGDGRGWFAEVWNRTRFAGAGIDRDWCQDNQSLSAEIGTLRGLHYQSPPFAQAKLVRVLTGAVRDVVVDVRRGSPTYGRHAVVDVTAEALAQIFVPAGFLHGFVTLRPGTMVLYKVDAPYSVEHDGGVAWNDPELGIDWGMGRDGLPTEPIVSARDAVAPRLADAALPFALDP